MGNLGVFGGGLWGTTLAISLAKSGHNVTLYTASEVTAAQLHQGMHPKIGAVDIPASLSITTELAEAAYQKEIYIEAVTIAGIRSLVQQLQYIGSEQTPIVTTSKGMEPITGYLPPEIILDSGWSGSIGVISGPSIAADLLAGSTTALIAASVSVTFAQTVQEIFSFEPIIVSTSTDPIGVCLGGAFKNVIAIAAGIADGLGQKTNTKALMLTAGFQEMLLFGSIYGVSIQSLLSFSGLGDLAVTCLSPKSRNYQLGYLLGSGKNIETAKKEIGMVIEGAATATTIIQKANEHSLLLPICEMVYAILDKRNPVSVAFAQMLQQQRQQKVHIFGSKVVTASEMMRIERLSLDKGIHRSFFIHAVGTKGGKAVDAFCTTHGLSKQIVLLIGKGNNGADALSIGITLLEMGYQVHAYHLFSNEHSCIELIEERSRFFEAGGEVYYPQSAKEIGYFRDGCVIDGIFGTGFNATLDARMYEIIEDVNNRKLPIIAVDIPSGIHGGTGAIEKIAINAVMTLALGLPKIGFFLGDAYNHIGAIEYIDFGLSKESIDDAIPMAHIFNPDAIKTLPLLQKNIHKYDAGYVLSVAGSTGMSGAAILSAHAAMRAGAGIVRVFHAHMEAFEFARAPVEIIFQQWDKTQFLEEATRANACVIGPGLRNQSFITNVLKEITVPCVLDADGLFLLKDEIGECHQPLVLTPHFGELKRLLNAPTMLHGVHFLEYCQEYAETKKVTLVVKGAPTFIFEPDQEPLIFPYGDPGMATAGSGDVLSGIIAALLAKGLSTIQAAALGVYLHAKSGEAACKDLGSYSCMASDIIAHLPMQLKRYKQQMQ